MGVFLWPCASLHCTTSPGCSFCVGESVAIPLKTRILLDVFGYFSGITECRATLYWLVPTTVIQGLLLHAWSPAQSRYWLLYGAELNFNLNLGDSHAQTNSLDRYKRAFFFVLVTRTISSDTLLLRYGTAMFQKAMLQVYWNVSVFFYMGWSMDMAIWKNCPILLHVKPEKSLWHGAQQNQRQSSFLWSW